MIIGIDLDDVLADFISEFTQLANAYYGRPAVGTEPVDWEWSNFGLSKEEQAFIWKEIQAIPGFWEKLKIKKGVDPRLVYRMDRNHTVYFPTARVDTAGDSAAKQSAYWLRKNFGIEFPAVFVAYDKGPMATSLKYDYFIDDRPKNCIDIQKALPKCKVYLKDSSHNRTFDAAANGFTRVKDFNEFANILGGEIGQASSAD
jgi:5'(3')-deoxyribonucleotidase